MVTHITQPIGFSYAEKRLLFLQSLVALAHISDITAISVGDSPGEARLHCKQTLPR
jgi:hypothetical protein